MGGGIQKRIYLVEHQIGLYANQKRQRIAQNTGGLIAHPDPKHWLGNSSMGGDWAAPTKLLPKGHLDCRCDRNNAQSASPKWGAILRAYKNQLRSVERGGFSQSSSSDRLTDEQREDLIAENIYDWWISGKSYKKWYADKFLQLKFEFEE